MGFNSAFKGLIYFSACTVKPYDILKEKEKHLRTYVEYTDIFNVSFVLRLELSITGVNKNVIDIRCHYPEGVS